jgi:hypothetical protein
MSEGRNSVAGNRISLLLSFIVFMCVLVDLSGDLNEFESISYRFP